MWPARRRLASDPPGRPSGLPRVGRGRPAGRTHYGAVSPRTAGPTPTEKSCPRPSAPRVAGRPGRYSPGSKSGTTAWQCGVPTRMPPPPAGKAEGAVSADGQAGGAGAGRRGRLPPAMLSSSLDEPGYLPPRLLLLLPLGAAAAAKLLFCPLWGGGGRERRLRRRRRRRLRSRRRLRAGGRGRRPKRRRRPGGRAGRVVPPMLP